jgi:hypothetical protein
LKTFNLHSSLLFSFLTTRHRSPSSNSYSASASASASASKDQFQVQILSLLLSTESERFVRREFHLPETDLEREGERKLASNSIV